VTADERIREAALQSGCDTCSAQPGQQCRRTKAQQIHYPRRVAGAKSLGLKVEARPKWRE
jgi:hypothetical protein